MAINLRQLNAGTVSNGMPFAVVTAQTVFDGHDSLYGMLIGGTLSAAGLYIDGVGNQSVTPAPGTLVLSASVSGTSLPTTTPTAKTIYADSAPFAWGYVSLSGNDASPTITFRRGFNINNVAYGGSAGLITVTFARAASSIYYVTVANLIGTLNANAVVNAQATGSCTFNCQGAATSNDFDLSFVVFGG